MAVTAAAVFFFFDLPFAEEVLRATINAVMQPSIKAMTPFDRYLIGSGTALP